MNFIYKHYKIISEIGIRSDMTYLDKLSIRVINRSAFFLSCALILSTFLGSLVKDPHPFFSLIFLPLGFISFIFHYYGKYIWSRFYALIVIPIFLFGCFILYGSSSGIQYLFLIFVMAGIPFFKKSKHTILHTTYISSLYFIGVFYNKNYKNPLESSVAEWEYLIFQTITFLFIIWTIITFYNTTTKQADDLKIKNKELARQNRALQDAIDQNNIKTQLLSVLTHDLRGSAYTFNNLTNKVNYLIQKNEPNQLLAFGSHFEEQGEKLIHNIENLLAWIKTQQEVMNAELHDVQPRKIVEKVIEDLRPAAREKSITISNKIDSVGAIHSDRNLLKIIIQNLIHNSIKYSPENTCVIIDLKSTNTFHNIIIKDQGKGMSQAEIDVLHSSKKKINNKITNHGYGIGLNICLSFVKVLKGELIFEKRKERGLQVTIQLPKKG